MRKRAKRTVEEMPLADGVLPGTGEEVHRAPQVFTPASVVAPTDHLPPAASTMPTTPTTQLRQRSEGIILPGREQQILLHGSDLGHTYLRRRLPPARETSAFLARG